MKKKNIYRKIMVDQWWGSGCQYVEDCFFIETEGNERADLYNLREGKGGRVGALETFGGGDLWWISCVEGYTCIYSIG